MSAAAERPAGGPSASPLFMPGRGEGLFGVPDPISTGSDFLGAEELELEFAASGPGVDLFEGVLIDLGHRSNTVGNITTYTSAWPSATVGEIFRIYDIRPEVEQVRSGDSRRFTRLIDNGAVQTDQICLRLASEAAPRAEAMVLEVEEIAPTDIGVGFEMASVSLVGTEMIAPVWFERTDVATERRGRVEAHDHRLAHDVVEKARADLESLGHEAPPLFAHDTRFGENRPLGRHLRELEIEHVLRIPNDFDEAIRPRDSSSRGRIGLVLDQEMRFAEDGSPPAPVLVSSGPPQGAHTYVFGVPGMPPGFVLVHPGIRSGPGGLTGNRGRVRGAELVDLFRSSGRPRVLGRLGLDRFHHPSREGWRASAALLALRRAAGCGLLAPSPR
jgi:hypothetical protein